MPILQYHNFRLLVLYLIVKLSVVNHWTKAGLLLENCAVVITCKVKHMLVAFHSIIFMHLRFQQKLSRSCALNLHFGKYLWFYSFVVVGLRWYSWCWLLLIRGGCTIIHCLLFQWLPNLSVPQNILFLYALQELGFRLDLVVTLNLF